MDIRPIDANALEDRLDTLNPVDYGSMSSYETHVGARDALSDVRMFINDAPTLSLNTLRDAIYQDAVAHGLWEEGTGSDDDRLRAVVKIKAEVDELFAESVLVSRHGTHCMNITRKAMDRLENLYFDASNRFISELADVVIMCFSVAGKLGIDIDAAIRRKMEINKGRPWKHGKGE